MRPAFVQTSHVFLFSLLVGTTALTAQHAVATEKPRSGKPANADTMDIVENIRSRYARSGDFRARFVQTTAHKLFAGKLERAYGELFFKRGGRMRWEYTRPERKLFVYDGATLWIYEPDVPQVFRGAAELERFRRALAFLGGEARLSDDYTVERQPAERFGFAGHVLALYPKDRRSSFRYIEVYVNKDDYQVVRSVIVDREGNRNRFDFSPTQSGEALSDSLFSFTPPAGVPVIDANGAGL